MKSFDRKIVLIAAFLFLLGCVASLCWESMSKALLLLLSSHVTTLAIWLSLVITVIIHFVRKYPGDENEVSKKQGMERTIDYLQFIFTYGAIGASIQTLGQEIFTHFNFPELSRCPNFTQFDNFSFFATVIVLAFYTFGKIKPVFQEAYFKKNVVSVTRDTSSPSQD